MDPGADIDSWQYLLLSAIEEPSDNVLRLVVEQAEAAEKAESIRVGGTVLDGLHRIARRANSSAYEVVFPKYIAYSVRNESYTVADEAEEYDGRLFRVYRKSKFLEYVREATIATADFPGTFTHYEMVCENHIVDVVTPTPPVFARVRGAVQQGDEADEA